MKRRMLADTMAPTAIAARAGAWLGLGHRWATVVPADGCFQHSSNVTTKRPARRLGRHLT